MSASLSTRVSRRSVARLFMTIVFATNILKINNVNLLDFVRASIVYPAFVVVFQMHAGGEVHKNGEASLGYVGEIMYLWPQHIQINIVCVIKKTFCNQNTRLISHYKPN